MAQQMQQKKMSQPVAKQSMQPMAKTAEPMGEKKMKWWVWLIIALVIIAAGVGIYLFVR